MLLLRCGDIESNPGPAFRNCPACDIKISIRKTTCLCGHQLRKSTIPASTVKHTNESTMYASEDLTCNTIEPQENLSDSVHTDALIPLTKKFTNSQFDVSYSDVCNSNHSSLDSSLAGITSVHHNSASQSVFSATKWQKYRQITNRNRRNNYKANPHNKCSENKEYYHSSQPEISSRKHRVYNTNSLPAKERARKQYNANSLSINQ